MKDAFIFDGLRSSFGRHGGTLARMRPDDLAASVVAELVGRNGLAGDNIEDVILGNTNQAGEDSRNLARHVALLAELPTSIPGMTVNRLCGSGLAALADAARCVLTDQGALFIAGGVESMSRAPLVLSRAPAAFSRGQTLEDSTLGSRFPNPLITERFGDPSMAETADNVARDLDISRHDSDTFALSSQTKYQRAKERGFFQEEIHPVSVPSGNRKLPPEVVCDDEHPRPKTALEKLGTLSTLDPDGVVTAGNASGLNDGAAALVIGSSDTADELALEPRARLVSTAVAGVEPRVMGLGPVPASQKALARAGLSLEQMDVIEINEAFAPQVLGCLKVMGIAADDERVNPNGGAIAIGHPLGASGARLALTAMRQLESIDGRYALISMCIGVGQGIAVIIERVNQAN